MYRRLCDNATNHIKEVLQYSLNTQKVGALYAGDVEHRGVDSYLEQAFKLGKKLV